MKLYHGLSEQFEGINQIVNGLWFVTNTDVPIFDYYKSRTGIYIVAEWNPKHEILDLTDIDVDETINFYDVEEFIYDICYREYTFGDIFIKEFINEVEDNIRVRNEGEEDYYTISEIINYFIGLVIRRGIKISGLIIQESGYETVCVFDREELNKVRIVKPNDQKIQ